MTSLDTGGGAGVAGAFAAEGCFVSFCMLFCKNMAKHRVFETHVRLEHVFCAMWFHVVGSYYFTESNLVVVFLHGCQKHSGYVPDKSMEPRHTKMCFGEVWQIQRYHRLCCLNVVSMFKVCDKTPCKS